MAFVLPASPRHRGTNEGAEPAQLFLIDAIPHRSVAVAVQEDNCARECD